MEARLGVLDGDAAQERNATMDMRALPRDLGVEEVWENEERLPTKGTFSAAVHGRGQWSDREGNARDGKYAQLPPGDGGIPWRWISDWEVNVEHTQTD
eukprot:COSAG06_NODE_54731_length_293_cov_0.783505_1_plen_97_part_11